MLAARLNVDVLTVIISEFLSDDADVLSFTLVCSSLRPVANERLLYMHPISLRRDVSFRSFHSLIFADAVTLAPHIRALHVGGRRFPHQLIALQPSGFSSLAVDIICSCNRLEHVTMFFEQGSTDDDEPTVLAVAALKTLRSLTISSWSADTLRLLHNLSSPIRKLAINSTYARYPDILEEFLPRLAPALEELELLHFRVQRGKISAPHDASLESDAFLGLTQYPAVCSFSVLCLTGSPLLAGLQHLFPALNGTLSLGLLDPLVNRSPIDDIRVANQRAQQDSAWEKLDRVVCDAPMLYALGLRCPIRLVMLDKGSADADADADAAGYTAAAMRENPVPRLKLTLRCGRGMLDGLFTPELAGTLSHLTLCLVHDTRDGASRGTQADAEESAILWDDLLDTMLTALQPLHALTHLRIVISCKGYRDPTPSESSSSRSFVVSVRDPAFDFAGTAAMLVRALPSLQYVFLRTTGSLTARDLATAPPWRASAMHERWDVSRAWRVNVAEHGPGGARGLVELHGDVAETIMRNEELVLSQTDEATLFSSKEVQREVSGIGVDELTHLVKTSAIGMGIAHEI